MPVGLLGWSGEVSRIGYVPPLDDFGLAAAPWVFLVLYGVTLGLHFLCMNATVGATVLAVWLDLRAVTGGKPRDELVRTLWHATPVTLSLTITTGVAPLLFVQVLYGSFFYPATILMGWTWFAVIPVLIAGFYILKIIVYRLSNAALGLVGGWDHRPGVRLAWGIPVLLCYLVVAWILTQNHMLELQPEQWPVNGQWKQTRWIITPELSLPRYGHNIGGALVVGGMWVSAMGWWRRARGVGSAEHAGEMIRVGLSGVLVSLIAAVVLGPLMFFGLPETVRGSLMRPGLYAGLWWGALLAVVGQLGLVVYCLRHPDRPGPFVGLCGLVVIGLTGMIAAREQVRLSFLGRPSVGFDLRQWGVHAQASSLLVFLSSFVVALLVVGWIAYMVATARRTPAESHGSPTLGN